MTEALTARLLRQFPLPGHEGEVDKDERGRVLAVGGSAEVPGGILLSALAALRAGAGKLQVAAPKSIASGLAFALPEARVVGLDEADGDIAASARTRIVELGGRNDAVIVGPGILEAAAGEAAALAALAIEEEVSIVLDAAAIGDLRLAARACQRCAGRLVLTPHAGEMATLMDVEIEAVQADPAGFAAQAAEELGAVVAMKGGTTHVASPDGEAWVFEGGCVGLATSGSGDVLAGVIGGLLARGADAVTATLWGVLLHGTAGQRLSKRIGPVGFLARELPAEIPVLLAELD